MVSNIQRPAVQCLSAADCLTELHLHCSSMRSADGVWPIGPVDWDEHRRRDVQLDELGERRRRRVLGHSATFDAYFEGRAAAESAAEVVDSRTVCLAQLVVVVVVVVD